MPKQELDVNDLNEEDSKPLDEFLAEEDYDPEDEDDELYEEDSGYFPSLLDKRR